MLVVLIASFGEARDRSRCLAEVGFLLAQNGQRVACSSLDSNAYALDRLLCAGDDDELRRLRDARGLFDLVSDYCDALVNAPADAARLPESPERSTATVSLGTLAVDSPAAALRPAPIAAGLPLYVLRGGPFAFSDDAQSRRAVDWQALGLRWGGADYFEFVKSNLAEKVDVLLVDCPCGTPADPAIAQFVQSAADTMVMLSSYREDECARAFHFLGPLAGTDGYPAPSHRMRLLVAPIADAPGEFALLMRARENFQFNFQKFLPPTATPTLLQDCEIKIVPYFQHSPELVGLSASTGDRAAGFAYRCLADAIRTTAAAARPVVSFDELATRFANLPGRSNWDVFISYGSLDEALALRLRGIFAQKGWRTFVSGFDLSAQVGTDQWLAAIRRILARSRILVVLATQAALDSPWVKEECSEFDHLRAEEGSRTLVPVCLAPIKPRDLDEVTAKYQSVVCDQTLDDAALALLTGLIERALQELR